MTNIDYEIFNENLLLTQAYCELQLNNGSTNPATIFRTINPLYEGKPMFSFKPYTTEWEIDPLPGTCGLFYELYKNQLSHKKVTLPEVRSDKIYYGRILVAEVDMTVVDGASEDLSEGLVDSIDCPPIDTWFYYCTKDGYRILFAWIPEQFVELANSAIAVNCVDCIYWFNKNDWDSSYYRSAVSRKTQAEDKSVRQTRGIWSRFKKIFSK